MDFFQKLVTPNYYFKQQYDPYNIKYTSDMTIQSGKLKLKRVVSDGEMKAYQEVTYVSNKYAAFVNDSKRITTIDKVYCTNPSYEYYVETYDKLENESDLYTGNNLNVINVGSYEYAAVFFDIETGGFSYEDDILQISMKCGSSEFDSYINPTQKVNKIATEKTGLSAFEDDLLYNGREVKSLPLELVLLKLLYYLVRLKKKSILVAHNNFSFDMPRLLKAIEKFSLLSEFKKVIEGFSDTLPLFKETLPNRRKNEYNLAALARDFGISFDNPHNSKYDVLTLEKLAEAALGMDKIGATYKPLEDCLSDVHHKQKASEIKSSYAPMRHVISNGMITRLANAGISYEDIVNSYENDGVLNTESLLSVKKDGKATLIKSNKIMNDILRHLHKRKTMDTS